MVQECQKAHWKAHKESKFTFRVAFMRFPRCDDQYLACKTSFQSPDWQPVWVDDNRRPDFGKDGPRM